MIKRITPAELPETLTDDILYILAEMAEENPVSQEWIDCSKKLTDDQKFKVYELRSLVKENKEKEFWNSLSDKERLREQKKRNEWYKNADPDGFYGNMGNPEYP